MVNLMFYFLLTLTAVLAATKEDGLAVLDFDADYISNGSYYVIPCIEGAEGGGLTLGPRGGNKCPLYIGQEDSEIKNGIPVSFSNWSSSEEFVTESVNLNIEMDIKDTICSEPTYWRIAPSVVPLGLFIKAGRKPSKGLFQIKAGDLYLNSYQIFFCPDGFDCTKVGIFVDRQGVRRLALNSEEFEFWFEKANGTETSSRESKEYKLR